MTTMKTTVSACVLALGLTSAADAQGTAQMMPQPNATVKDAYTEQQARFECDTRLKVKPQASANTATAMRTCMDELMRGAGTSK